MTGVLGTLKKDANEYMKLGRLVLSINTVLAMVGPAITGLAATDAGIYGFQVSRAMALDLEEEIEFNLEEADVKERENGELFKLRMDLQLGRSPSELRTLSSSCPQKH
ncbi:hypothetical protein Taro_000934 [Colocasia esculenta]|uniref:Uncharacterized protein n=1 Tax=Colocasia esculenta TaxID=4460 RepID=A0A843TGC1_COLES|nr:hypothetical protein [Colocasia esculenta]